MALAYLFAPTTQFQARTGANLTAGFLRVFYTQTDDAAPTYSDFAATPNEEEIVLDADGRAVVIVDNTKTYRLEVYNRNHGLMFTVDPLTAVGGAGGSMAYSIVSTDGTVSIESTSSGGVIYYDLSTAISNEAAKWGARECAITSLDGSNDWQPLNTVSTVGSVVYYYGWKATKDTAYDFAASVEMPSGIAGATFGIDVKCEFLVDGVCVCTETGYIDPSRNVDRVSFEYKGQVDEGQKLDARLYARCAQALSGTLIGRVFYNEECDGVVGGESTGETYIPGEYIDISTANVISVTGVQPVSGMSAYVQQSAFDDCCSAMSGYVSSLSSDVSAISAEISSITGLTGDYVEKSAISGVSAIWNEASGVSSKLDASASGEFYSTSNPSGFITNVDLSDYATTAYVDSSVSGKVDETAYTAFTSQASSDISSISSVVSGITGDWSGKADQSALDLKLDKSASSNFYPMTGNPSGFITEHQELTGYVEKSAISAQSSQWDEVSAKADTSALTAYQPVSAMSGYQPSGDYAYNSSVSGKQDASAMSAYALSSDVSGVIDTVSANSATWAGASGDYVEKSSTEVTIGSANTAQYTSMAQGDSNLASAGFSFAQGSANTAYSISLAQGVKNSAAYNSFAQGQGASAGGTSFAQGNHISARSCSFAQGEAVSASGTSFAQGIQTVAVGTSVAIGHYLKAGNRMVAFGQHNISGDDLALVIGDGWYMPGEDHPHNLFEVKKSGDIVLYSGSADTTGWSVKDAVGAKLDASESSKFYSTSNPSGFLTGIPTSYATKDYVDSSLSGKADTSSLTAYQPSGDYAYNSSLSGLGGYYVEKSSTEVAVGDSNSAITNSMAQGSHNIASSNSFAQGSKNSAKLDSFAQGSGNIASSRSFAQGIGNTATSQSFAQGNYNSARYYSLALGYNNNADNDSFAQGNQNSAISTSFAQGSFNRASDYSFAQGLYNSAKNTAAVFGQYNLHGDGSTSTGNSAAFAIGDGTAKSARHDLMLVTKDGEITMFSSTADTTGTGILSAIRAISAATTGGVDSATVSAIASAYAESAASSKLDSSASSNFYTTANESGYLTAHQSLSSVIPWSALEDDGTSITAISGSAIGPTSVGKVYSGIAPIVVDNDADTISISGRELVFEAPLSTSESAGSSIVSIDLGAYQTTAGMTAYQPAGDYQPSGDYAYNSSLSGYIPTSESASYQLTADMTAYQPSGDYIYASALGTGEI